MAFYTGYQTVAHSTYDEWRNIVNGNGYDVDGSYGSQCWDLASLFWWNIGFPMYYPELYNHNAYTMWERREHNATYNGVTYFDFVYNINDVKRGDIMVFKQTSSNTAGHVGFADEDFSTWTPSDPNQPYEFPILSQNNGGIPDPRGGSCTNIHGYDYRLFIGAFRYKDWQQPVPPTPTEIKHRFPFVLYARKLRNKAHGL